MSAPRPYVTEPFRQLSSINIGYQFLYIQQHSSYLLHVVRSSVSCCGANLTIAHELLQKHRSVCLAFLQRRGLGPLLCYVMGLNGR